ncbi:MAG: carboxypeptidase M32, partial [Phycisphaerae bacterium]
DGTSLGMHESQSRLWENLVGRSREFWSHYFPAAQKAFPDALATANADDFYCAINRVQPSLIRVEADEVTYNLHIVVRFRIERDLLAGKIGVNDIPAVWNDTMSALLGVTPAHDAEGCLQDIHWSMGALGYFPTYALGNLYAAQFFEQARKDIPDLEDHIRNGRHQPLRTWLRENIHMHGRRYGAGELVERVTGRPLSIKPFMDYITGKVSDVYGL